MTPDLRLVQTVKETRLKETRRYGPAQKLMSTTTIVIGIETVVRIASILFEPDYELGQAGKDYLARRHQSLNDLHTLKSGFRVS
jgi:hypothetical protein